MCKQFIKILNFVSRYKFLYNIKFIERLQSGGKSRMKPVFGSLYELFFVTFTCELYFVHS